MRERYTEVSQRELPTVLVPGNAKKGDTIIVLEKYNEEYQQYEVDLSSEHYIYSYRSSEARYSMKSADK